MTWKKTWFSYLLWAFYTFGVSILAVSTVWLAGSRWGLDRTGILVRAGIVCLPFFTAGAVYILIRLIRKNITRVPGRESTWLIVECILAVALIGAGIALRIYNLPETGDTVYYELAKVAEGKSVEVFAHGALYYYLMLLHTLFTFIGNQWIAGILLQIVLQVLAAVLLYGAVRKLAGVFPALVLAAGMMLLPMSIRASLEYSPKMLYLCLYGIGILWIAHYMGMIRDNRFRRWYQCIWLGLLGIYISFLTYMDVLGVTLLANAVTAVWVNRNREESEDGQSDGMVTLFVVIAGFIAGILCIFYLDGLSSSLPVMSVVEVWERLYAPEGFSFGEYAGRFLSGPGGLTAALCITTVLVMGIPGFFTRKGEEKTSIWTAGAVAAAGLSCQCLAASNMERTFLLEILLLILAGVALQNICFKEKKTEAAAVGKELVEVDLESEPETDVFVEIRTDIRVDVQPDMGGAKAVEERPEPPSVRTPVKYIENPLPLPKKHVKKKMGYKMEVTDEKLDFDLEIDEDDDFDLP